jgi:hypothetical protein
MKAHTLLKLFAVLMVAGTLWMLSASTAQAQVFCPNWMRVSQCNVWIANGAPRTVEGFAVRYDVADRPGFGYGHPMPVVAVPVAVPVVVPIHGRPMPNINVSVLGRNGGVSYNSGFGFGPSIGIIYNGNSRRRHHGGHHNNGGRNNGGHNNNGGNRR